MGITLQETSQVFHPQHVDLGSRSILVASAAMSRIFELVERLARTDLPVLITGETGSGKEDTAFAVHHWSAVAGGPFVALNCAAIPDELVESELFGHARGAFSGATSSKVGILEAASGGTVFLDEIGELSAAAQAKLLRALDTQRIRRVGEVVERPIQTRVVAATHRDLKEEVREGRFREDLYFRISAAVVRIPALRDRVQDIYALADLFLRAACEKLERSVPALSQNVTARLATYEWPGNVRELKGVMEYAAAIAGDRVELIDLPARMRADAEVIAFPAPVQPKQFRPLSEEIEELERTRIRQALEAANGVQTEAARLISMPLRTFVNKLNRYGLRT